MPWSRRQVVATIPAATLAAVLPRGPAVAQDGRKVVTFWFGQANSDGQAALRNDLVDAFNASQDKYLLQIEVKGAAVNNLLKVALVAGNGPDIVQTAGPAYLTAIANAGQVLALDDFAEKYKWKERAGTAEHQRLRRKTLRAAARLRVDAPVLQQGSVQPERLEAADQPRRIRTGRGRRTGEGHHSVRRRQRRLERRQRMADDRLSQQRRRSRQRPQGARGRDALDGAALRRGRRSLQGMVQQGIFRQELFLADNRAELPAGRERQGGDGAERHVVVRNQIL